MALQFPQILNLDDLDVYFECDPLNPMYFRIDRLPNTLTYGKHYFTISYSDPEGTNMRLRETSNVLFEFKDKRGNVIFSDLTEYDDTSGTAVGYMWIRKDPVRIYDEIADGIGYMTVVGELEGVPKEWEDKYNIRFIYNFEIRKSLEKISESLETIITIISDPGDELEHVYDAPKEIKRIWEKARTDRKDSSIHDLSGMD